jgi:hypothetical protein
MSSKDSLELNAKQTFTAEKLKDSVNEFASEYIKPTPRQQLTGNESPAELLAHSEVSQSEDIEREPVCVQLENNGTSYTLGTLGNFSLIIGKAKSRKTFFHSFFLGAWINNGILSGIFKATPPQDQPVCLYFDTEQSRYHVKRVLNRVLRMAGKTSCTNFKSYGLRTYSHAQRVTAIEYAIYNTPGVGLVVIDGARDLVSDINSAEEATKTAGHLLKWSEEKNIHIVTILHQNKGDNNARGHLGAELTNKAETTISVTKEGEISIVAPEYCRDKDFEPFAFGIDENGLPMPVDYMPAKEGKPRSITPNNLPEDIKRSALINAFKVEAKQKRATLLINLKLSFGELGQEFGDNKLRTFLQDYENNKMITKEGKAPHSFYSINILS